jgi:cytochrome c-type biogenesis protein CcmH/NrfF
MTIDALIMLVGAFVLIEPQLGFPTTWDTALLSIAGVLIIALGIAVRRRGLREPIREREVEQKV